MKRNRLIGKGMPLALLISAFAYSANATVADVVLAPGAMQPGGDANDTTLHWGTFWNDTGTVSQDFDTTMHSSNNIAGSIHVVFDCQGAPGQDPANLKSANLAFGDYFLGGSGGWLGQSGLLTVDASKYESLTLDLNIAATVSSNTPIPFCLYGAAYGNVALTNYPITSGGWQHVVIPIAAMVNLADCVAFGVYDWYNTTAGTAPAHVEFWMDNIMLVARKAATPPPVLSLAPISHSGLVFDSGVSETAVRGSIDSLSDVHWAGMASAGAPVSYSMTIGSVPDPAVYPNIEAHIFLAPNAGVGNPDWNLPEMGYLQILSHPDGTATARMMWKTNEPNGNIMLFNTVEANGYAAGTLGYLNATTMIGTWSISFTSDTDFILRGPEGVSTNLSLPSSWVESFNALGGVAYTYFGASPGAGQSVVLHEVAISGGSNQYALTNDFSSATLDASFWGALGTELFIAPSGGGWSISWTLPAVNFNLKATSDLANPNSWILLSGNTNLPVPVTTYTAGTNAKAFVASADLAKSNAVFFALQKQVVSKLQVLMPGETNAPGTASGKTGTPDPQPVGTIVSVTVNAVDANWNVVTYSTDQINLTSSDSAATGDTFAPLPLAGQLGQGTAKLNVIFGTAGSQTVTASDTTQTTVASGTSASTSITP